MQPQFSYTAELLLRTETTIKSMTNHYDAKQITHSFLHFITGKVFTAISTLSILLLLARSLSKPEYAAYVTFEALTGLTGLLASFGINQTVLRYTAELRASNNGLALYFLIRKAIISRAIIFAFALLILTILTPIIANFLGFSAHIHIFYLYMFAGWIGLICALTGSIMETLLWQKSTQYTYAATAALRLLLIGSCYLFSNIDLLRLVSIDIIYESMTLLVMLFGLYKNKKADPNHNSGSLNWFSENRDRIKRYAIAGYGYSLSTLLYGSQPNRAVSARYLSTHSMGDFGFADSLANLFNKFLPSNLLQGFLRPIYFVRYAESKQIYHLERMANLIFRINLTIMSIVALTTILYGQYILGILTSGKYSGTVYLLAAMLGVLVLESLQNQHILVCQTLENNHLLVYANIIRSCLLIAVIPLFVNIGAWAIVLANTVGNLLAIYFVRIMLGRAHHAFKLDIKLIANSITSLIFAAAIGITLKQNGYTILGGLAGLSLFITMNFIIRSYTDDEVIMLKNLLIKNSYKRGATHS